MLANFRTVPIKVALVLLSALLVAACGGGENTNTIPLDVPARDRWALTWRWGSFSHSIGEVNTLSRTFFCRAVTCSRNSLSFYLSPNDVISSQDFLVGSVPVASMVYMHEQGVTLRFITPEHGRSINILPDGTRLFGFDPFADIYGFDFDSLRYWGTCINRSNCS